MKVQKYKYYDKKCYSHVLHNGLRVYVIPTKEKSVSAHVFVNFGNEDVLGTINNHKIPNGVAHFLEHRLFDLDGKKVMDEFQKMNCSTNAYTCSELTTYYFNTNDYEHIKEPLNLLLDMTDTCKMSKQAFENEKSIIINELNMGLDNQLFQAYSKLKKLMFGDDPYALDTIGTVESVSNTTLNDLKRVHNYFYRPDNKIVVVCGNVKPKEIINIIKDNQSKKVWNSSVQYKKYTPKIVEHKECSTMKLSLANEKTLIGLKIDKKLYPSNQSLFKLLTTAQILFKLLFANASKFNNLYQDILYVKGTNYVSENIKPDFIEVYIMADTLNAKEFIKTIKKVLNNPDDYIDYCQFKAYKNSDIASTLDLDENESSLCDDFGRAMCEYNLDIFNDIEEGISVTIDDVKNMSKIIKNAEITELIYKVKK